MATKTLSASPGDDLYRIAAQEYGIADGWTLIAKANGLVDPVIQTDVALIIPDFNEARLTGGVL